MHRTALVAIGGNALVRPGEPATVASQRAHVMETCRALAALAAGDWRLVITHGNGPQVGAALRRSELAVAEAYPLTLDMCVASTQGEIGMLLQQALHDALAERGIERPIGTLLTQVVVSPEDPAFARPGKPVGAFLTREQAAQRRRAGWAMVEEPPHGYRRVVPSPMPQTVVEEATIRALVASGVIVVAAGGGGVPVVRDGNTLRAVEAVVDKDLTSALLAARLPVSRLAMVTDVDRLYVNFARPGAQGLGVVDADELHRLAGQGHFPEGTMAPKVAAALRFLHGGGMDVIVTDPSRLVAAFQGREEGTHVVPGESAAHRIARDLSHTILG